MGKFRPAKFRSWILNLTAIYITCIIGEAAAATYYIAPNGADSNNGSSFSPWATFNYAISQLSGGDTLIANAGTYNQSIKVAKSGAVGKPITIRGTLDADGNQLSILAPLTTVSGWKDASGEIGAGVYKTTTIGFEPYSIYAVIGGEYYSITKLCPSNQRHANGVCYPTGVSEGDGWRGNGNWPAGTWKAHLDTDTDVNYVDSWLRFYTVPYWDGIEAQFAADSSATYIKFRGGGNPGTFTLKAAQGDTVDFGNESYITLENFYILGGDRAVYCSGCSNVTVNNNKMIGSRLKIKMNTPAAPTISNNELTAQTYADYAGSHVRGAWLSTNVGANSLHGVNNHLRVHYKYACGPDDAGNAGGGMMIVNAAGATISGNTVHDNTGNMAISIASGNVDIYDNTVYNAPNYGIVFAGSASGTHSVYDNTVYNTDGQFRWQNFQDYSAVMYMYGNKLWNPPGVGEHLYFHHGRGGLAPSPRPNVWIYHNTISGGYRAASAEGATLYAEATLEDTKFINNIFSVENLHDMYAYGVNFIDIYAYNWQAGNWQPTWWGDEGNISNGTALMWNTTTLRDFVLPNGSNARNAGIDVSKPFTVDGKTIFALPGFDPGYFSGSKPHMGAVQSINYNTGNTALNILKTNVSPIIDGNLGEYTSANPASFSSSAGGNTVTARALWNSEAVYIGINVTDSQLNGWVTTRDGSVWNEDAVEWFIDTNNNGGGQTDPSSPYMLADDYHGIVNILNAQYDAKGTSSGSPSGLWNGSWQSAVQINGTLNNNSDSDTGYTVEIKIPWTSIGYSAAPAEATLVGMSFAIDDKDISSTSYGMWSSTAGSFQNASNSQNVSLAGTTVLADTQAPAPPPFLLSQ